ncbi:Scr1 family TA system antitoxin-like transcriptional regulator [Actinomadura viridis]|uniref:helix-turn-helix domain-containing protein n=1 Tax=Actinomadura viridis TaxID=58110 RepID=UPI00368874BC
MGRPPNPLNPNNSFAEHYGWKIRTLRESRNWSLDDLAERIACSPSHLSKLERAQKSPDEKIARLLDAAFGSQYFAEHYEVAARDRLPATARSLGEYEAEATQIRAYMPTLVVGLLQTEAYTRAIVMSGPYRADVEEIVAERMRRQTILDGVGAPRLLVVVDEAALRRVVGGKDVMQEQLARIEVDMAKPNILVQVVPGDTAEYAALSGGFELLSLAEGGDIAYVEAPSGAGRMLEDPDILKGMDETYDLARSAALSTTETARLIKEIRESL